MGGLGKFPNTDEMNALIDTIYEAGLAPERWKDTLEHISSSFHAGAALLQGYSNVDCDNHFVVVSDNLAGGEQEYATRYLALDPRIDYLRRNPQARVAYDYLHTTEREMRRSEYYAWFVRTHGLQYYLALRLEHSATGAAVCTLQFSPQHGHVDPDTIARFEILRPHLMRAFRTTRVLERERNQQQSRAEALDTLNTAVMSVDRIGRVKWANQAARSILTREDGLKLVSGQLVAERRAETQAMYRRLKACRSTERTGQAPRADLAISRSSGAIPHEVMLVPAGNKETFPSTSDNAGEVLLFVKHAGDGGRLSRRILQEKYNTTATEIRICSALAEGAGVTDLMEMLGVRESTIRTHIRNIMSKTQTSRQAQLVAVLNTLRRGWGG